MITHLNKLLFKKAPSFHPSIYLSIHMSVYPCMLFYFLSPYPSFFSWHILIPGINVNQHKWTLYLCSDVCTSSREKYITALWMAYYNVRQVSFSLSVRGSNSCLLVLKKNMEILLENLINYVKSFCAMAPPPPPQRSPSLEIPCIYVYEKWDYLDFQIDYRI